MHLRPLLLLLWLSGCRAAQDPVTGPGVVSGPEGGSLSLLCNYTSYWKTYKKYWCRGSNWGDCTTLVSTTGSEQEVKKDRISIRDDQKNLRFTVTMKELRRDDAGIYWCAITKAGYDRKSQVTVSVDPAPTTVMTTVPTTCTTNTFTAPDTTEDTTLTSHYDNDRPDIMSLSILLPVIFAVLLFLLLVASLLAWRMVKRQRKAAEMSAEQGLQPPENDICYAHLSLKQPGTSQKKALAELSSSAQANQAEVEYVTMAPFPREEVSYASLSLDQEPTYGNTGHVPRWGYEEPTEYSSIRSP